MKRLLLIILICVLAMPVLFLSPLTVAATTSVYDNDQVGWEAAVGSWCTEDFDDATLNPEISVVSDYGYVHGSGVWYDELYYSGQPTSFTTWTFGVPICAFGGTWDLGTIAGGDPNIGGPGSNIEVLINGSWESVGVIDREYIDVFWGFVSDVPFTQVRLQAYNNQGTVERYSLDDMVYSRLAEYLTGGGQIVAGEGNRKNQYVVSFAGNLGYAGDLILMGQYQFHFHNVSVDALDGAIFHSTCVSILEFYQDSNDGPAPPPAEANVAYFRIDGRFKLNRGKFQDGYTIYAMVADRGEPGMNDSINFALWEGATVLYSSTWDFPCNAAIMNGTTGGTKLTCGNLQIHADYMEVVV